MLRWLKRDEGFEWHKHVRTTIKMRRDDRRRRVEQIGDQVASSGQSAIGSMGAALWHLLQLVAFPFVWAWQRMFGRNPFGRSIAGSLVYETGRMLSQPLVRLIAGLLGTAALVSAIAAFTADRVDTVSRLALLVGVVLVIVAAAPLLGRYVLLPVGRPVAGVTQRVSGINQATSTGMTMALGAGVVLAVSGLATLATQSVAPGLTAPIARIVTGSTGMIEGRGVAVGSDMLRVGDTLVRLADIEAPAGDQKCVKAAPPGGSGRNRRPQTTPCQRAALDTLQGLVRAKTVQCIARGTDGSGRVKARCLVDGTDLAQVLVREGYAKSASGLFASYTADESAARTAKAGIWGAPEPTEVKRKGR